MQVGIQDTARWGKVPAWWLRHAGVDADGFAVLAALATYADDAGECDPSQATIARWLQRSRPWVNKVISNLVETGLVEKTLRTRANGGTTSCRYRLSSTPPGSVRHAEDIVCPDEDGGRHHSDRNQTSAKQKQYARTVHAQDAQKSQTARAEGPTEVPKDWEPSDAAVSAALKLRPEADMQSHTARFVARCRSKGYRYPPATVDDAWLSWLLEDTEADGKRIPRGGSRAKEIANQTSWPGATGLGNRFDRFAAWASVASPRDQV